MADLATELAGPEPAPKKDREEDDNLATLVGWFEDAEEATIDARQDAERDVDYYHGKQYTDDEMAELRRRRQPIVVNNEIQRKIDFLTGFEATQRTDPKAFPRNPDDEQAAEAATDMLRYQETASDLDQLFSDVWEDMLIPGFGGVEVLGQLEANPNTIEVILWNWDRLFYDPHSRKHDFSDANYLGGVIWQDASQFKTKWPEKADLFDQTVSMEPVNSDTYDDRPRHNQWAIRGKRNRIRVVQMYYREGKDWHFCVFTRAGKIDSQRVEFLDENGDPTCPLILQSAYVDRENNRYGMVRQLIGPQDEVNKRASKALHLITVTGGIYEEGAVENIEEFATKLAQPDGWGKVNAGALGRVQPRDAAKQAEAASNIAMLREAKESIQLKGPNAALSGKQDSAASGRAIRASQEGGIVELARLRDRHTHFKRRVYRALWNRVRQFLTEETWIRVTDNEDNLKFVGFNRQVTFAEIAAKQLKAQGVPEDQIDAKVIELAQQQGKDPNGIEGVENVPAEMDMDILIENATESINIQEEQFEMLTQLASAGIQFPPEVYIKASSLRNKDELLDLMKPDAGKQQAEMEAIKLNLAKVMAQINDLEASADQKRSAAFVNAAKAGVMPPQQAFAPPEPNTGAEGFGAPQQGPPMVPGPAAPQPLPNGSAGPPQPVLPQPIPQAPQGPFS